MRRRPRTERSEHCNRVRRCMGSGLPMMNFTGWVRIQLPDVIKTRRISILMGATMQLLEVVTGHSQFLSHFSIPQAIPTQPVNEF